MTRKPKRRKPRRKKQIVNATQSNDIPFSKYRIEWMDILSDSGWATDKEFHRMKLAFPVNEGWLFSKDRYTIKEIRNWRPIAVIEGLNNPILKAI